MTDSKSFEDQFDHDPNAEYEEEQDLDLGPDEEYADRRANESRQASSAGRNVPKGGCLGGLLKVSLSLGLICFCYFYIVNPEKFTAIQTKITEMFSSEKEGAPDLSLGKTEKTDADKKPAVAPKPKPPVIPDIVLHGAGVLPDFKTVAKQNPALNSYLIMADRITFETLDTHHNLVAKMIADWAKESDEEKIAEIVQMPYKQFFARTSASLLSQTLFKRIGLTPVNTTTLVAQAPVHVMAAVYPPLKAAMAGKTNDPDKLRTAEPVSSFLLYMCRSNYECLASWDLLIDMLNIKQYAKRLEKAPETIYTGRQ